MPWEKTVGEARPAITATNIAAIVFFICLFSLIIFFSCANEPFARGFPCGRRSGGAPGRRLINLARRDVATCPDGGQDELSKSL